MMGFSRITQGTIQIIRPELPLAAGLCVAIGEVVALGTFPPVGAALRGFLLGFLLSSSAMVFNDYFDLELDRVNAPQRPLPAGLISPTGAVALGGILGLAGLAVAWSFESIVLGLGVIVWLAGFLYNWKLKSAGLWGNLIVSANVALTFILGGIAAGQLWNPIVWAFGAFAFCFDLAEEIADRLFHPPAAAQPDPGRGPLGDARLVPGCLPGAAGLSLCQVVIR